MFVVLKAMLVMALVSQVWGGEGPTESVTIPVNRCTLSSDTGLCRARFTRFYYDFNTGTCKEFIYGGCGGNGNRFDTTESCMLACGGTANKC